MYNTVYYCIIIEYEVFLKYTLLSVFEGLCLSLFLISSEAREYLCVGH